MTNEIPGSHTYAFKLCQLLQQVHHAQFAVTVTWQTCKPQERMFQ